MQAELKRMYLADRVLEHKFGEVIIADNPPCQDCKWLKAEIRLLKEKANFTCDEVIVLARYVADLNRRIGYTKNYINDQV